MQRIEDPNSVGPESLSSVAPVSRGVSVVAQVERELRESPYLSLRRIKCEYHEGVLTLRGNVSTYYVKQLAQTIALRNKNVDEVANRINVVSPND
jgi:osmotically-inducible protein OsmY